MSTSSWLAPPGGGIGAFLYHRTDAVQRKRQRMSNSIDFDRWLGETLSRMAGVIPARWQRWLATYYPDARVRRTFWRRTKVEIGEGSYANIGMIVADRYRDGECLLFIKDHVSIAPNVVFICESTPNNSAHLRSNTYVAERLIVTAPIVVEDHAWIGASVTILPGVRIGKGAIIGAGSVVTRDIPPYCVAAGVPARVLRHIDDSNQA
jgi:acetyltransferase-like isoleucine patch superfamily enzyme